MVGPATAESALLDIASHLGATVDLELLLEVALDRFTQLLSAERAAFVLFTSTGRVRGLLTHNLNWNGDLDDLPLSQGLLEATFRGKDVLVVPDALEDALLGARESVRLRALRMMAGVPIVSGEHVTAVLYADARHQAASDWPSMIPVLRGLARLVASALENARLIEALRFRNRLMAEMVHELRSPITVTLMNAQLLLEGEHDESTRQVLEDIHSAASAQALTVDNALSLTKATLRVSRPEPIELGATLRAHVGRYRTVLEHRNKRVAFTAPDEGPLVETIKERLLVVFDNLLVNALKYSEGQAPITIHIAPREDAGPDSDQGGHEAAVALFRTVVPLEPVPELGFFTITVENQGPKVEPELLEHLFDPFARGKRDDRGFGSTGLGLSIAAQCVVHLGGRIWAESDERSTRISFTVPAQARPPGALPPAHA